MTTKEKMQAVSMEDIGNNALIGYYKRAIGDLHGQIAGMNAAMAVMGAREAAHQKQAEALKKAHDDEIATLKARIAELEPEIEPEPEPASEPDAEVATQH